MGSEPVGAQTWRSARAGEEAVGGFLRGKAHRWESAGYVALGIKINGNFPVRDECHTGSSQGESWVTAKWSLKTLKTFCTLFSPLFACLNFSIIKSQIKTRFYVDTSCIHSLFEKCCEYSMAQPGANVKRVDPGALPPLLGIPALPLTGSVASCQWLGPQFPDL